MSRPSHVPAELVVDYDAYADVSIEKQISNFEGWRSVGPVVWTDSNSGHWIVLSMSGCRSVLSDATTYSSAKPGQGTALVQVERPPLVPIEMDGAEQRQYRKVLIPLFSPQRVSLMEATVRDIARSLIDEFVERGSCEAVAEYARPLAGAMFMQLMDWPLADRHQLEHLVNLEINGPPEATTAEERAAAKRRAHEELGTYVEARLAERRESPDRAADMTTVLMNSTINDGELMPEDNLVSMLRLLAIAGLDTTQSVLSQTLSYLSEHTDAQAYVREHRSEIPRLVEEFLRLGAPALPSRTATVDCVLEGVKIAAGDTVHVPLPASNRDSGEFENPFILDLTRVVNRHVAFSVGPHKCIGAALARVVLAVALEEFHDAIGSYRSINSDSHVACGAVGRT